MSDVMTIRNWVVQLVLYITILVFGLGMSWAAYGARVTELEKVAVTSVKDHDTLVSLNTKMDLLLSGMSELKCDLKEHMSKK